MELDEAFKSLMSRNEMLQKQVFITEGHIVINVAYEYNIELSRCDTPEKILGWVEHLCEKTWVTPEVLRRFIHVATEHHKLTIVHT